MDQDVGQAPCHFPLQMDRRTLFRVSGQFMGTVAYLLSATSIGLTTGCSTGPVASPSPSQSALLKRLADIVLPGTETGGAGTDANIAFMFRAISAGLKDVPTDILSRLSAALDAAAGCPFQQLAEVDQRQLVDDFDWRVLTGPDAVSHPWYTVKALILMAYYTSQVGMTQELRYDVVPGDFVADVHVDTAWRAPSNDWAAVSIKKPLHA